MKAMPTAETLYKNIFGFTKEVVDILYEKSLITDEQHYTALKLRKIRADKFGKPYVKAKTLISRYENSSMGSKPYEDNEYSIYSEIIGILDKANLRKIVLDICVFDIMPKNYREIMQLKNGLDEITAHL